MTQVNGLVLVEREDAIALVTLNRPEAMNALSTPLKLAIADTFRALEDDDAVRAVVLTGAGERAFCAGLDLKELGTGVASISTATTADPNANPVNAIRACSKPLVGAINGVAITGGFELALTCDILLASENARFADTHARVGVMPGWGLSQILSRRIGLSRAMEMSLTGNFIDAHQACAWGLVNRVLPPQDLLGAAKALASEIAGIDPVMIRQYRKLIREGYALPFGEALDFEREFSSQANLTLRAEDVESRRAQVMARGRDQSG